MTSVDELLIQIRVDLTDVQTKLKTAQDQIKSLRDGTVKHTSDMSGAFESLGKVSEIVLGVSISQLAIRATDMFREFVVESVKQSIEFERSLQALQVQTGHTADALLKDLREATHGTISDLELTKSASKALAIGLDKDLLPGLAETAEALGKLTGEDAAKAFDDITTGIGRGSAKILDNLGIIIDEERAYKKYADTLGIATEALDKHTKSQILGKETIEQSIPIVNAMNAQLETTADKVEKAKARFSNFATEMGNNIIYDLQEVFTNINAVNDALEKDDAWVNARNNVNQYADAIIQSKDVLRDLSSELGNAKSALSDTLSGNTKSEAEVRAQEKINRLQNEFLHMKAIGTDESKMAVTIKQNEVELARNELEIIRSDKAVALDNEREKLISKGEIEKNYISGNLSDYINSIDAQVKGISRIEEQIGIEQQAQKAMNVLLLDAKKIMDDQNAIVTDTVNKQIQMMGGQSASASQQGLGGSSKGNMSHDPTASYVKFGNNLIAATKPPKNDFVMRPGQAAESFSAEDTLIGVKNPSALFGGKGGGGVNVTIGAIYGINAAEISRELRYRLQDVIPVS